MMASLRGPDPRPRCSAGTRPGPSAGCLISTVSEAAMPPRSQFASDKQMKPTPCVSLASMHTRSLMGLVDIRGSPPPRAPAGAAAIAAGICRAALCYLQPPMMVCGSAASATSSPPSPPSPSSSSSSSSSGRGRLRCSYGLSLLSTELVIHILSLAAPSLRQCVTLGPAGHPDVLPALLPSDPATWGPPPALPAPPPPPAPL